MLRFENFSSICGETLGESNAETQRFREISRACQQKQRAEQSEC